MRYTILGLLAATAVVALIVSFDLSGPVLYVFILFVLPTLVFQACLHLVYRAQMVIANRLVPLLYPRGMFNLLRWTCGKNYSAWALCNYAAKLSANAEFDAALKAYTRVLALVPACAEYWTHRGTAYYRDGNLTNALDDLTHGLKLNPDQDVATTYRGFTRLALGRFREAVDDLERIRCVKPEHSAVAFCRGYAREKLGLWHEAIQDYQQAQQLDPSEIHATISLARLRAGCSNDDIRDGTLAVEDAHRACVLTQWKDWPAVSVLAAAHAESGDFKKAIQFAELALELAPAEEKPKRLQRIEQFRQQIPFRIEEEGHSNGVHLVTSSGKHAHT